MEMVGAAGRYTALAEDREPFLQRARESAEISIPALMPPEGHTGTQEMRNPWQSIVASGINHLAAKLLVVLFPIGSPFFRLTLDDFVKEELMARAGGGAEGEDARAEFERALNKVERAVANRMEQRGARTPLYESLRQQIVAGNCLLETLKGGGLKMHRMDSYVVQRDVEGEPLEIILKRTVAKGSAPPEVREILSRSTAEYGEDSRKDVDIYTWAKRDGKTWRSHQETCGVRIEGTEGSWPVDKPRLLALRWTALPGEHYGRGLIEEHAGDIYSVESLTESVVDLAAISAKTLFFVDETGTTSRAAVARAKNGAVLKGRAEDVSVLRVEKLADLQVAAGQLDKLERRLDRVFLRASSIQRDAERVTAEELRIMAAELEASHGGTYSLLAKELQLPLATRVMADMQASGDLPPLPKEAVSPQIVAGLEALGRHSDLTRLDQLVGGLKELFGEQAISEWINVEAYVMRRATALGVDADGLTRTAEEVQQSRQQAAMQQMATAAAPNAVRAMAQQEPQEQNEQPA